MNDLTSKMQARARELLDSKEVSYVIGWEKGTFWYNSPPLFMHAGDEVGNLVWDEFCLDNLAHYLLEDRYGQGKVALFVKGCDSRGINRLLQDRQISRDRVYLIGIPCPGLKDKAKAGDMTEDQRTQVPLAPRCEQCTHKVPVVFDELLGAEAGSEVASTVETIESREFPEVVEFEALDANQRYEFWGKQFDRCLRCFACRNVCPACNCTVCCFDIPKVGWLGKQVNQSENSFYHLTRAFHVAGRCIECGECEQVCPVDIPIMTLNKKLVKDINELFGPYEAGLDLEAMPPLGIYCVDDPDEFL